MLFSHFQMRNADRLRTKKKLSGSSQGVNLVQNGNENWIYISDYWKLNDEDEWKREGGGGKVEK